MATSSTVEGQHAVNVSCAVEYEELSFKTKHEVTVVCTLEAPLMQDQDRESRAPIDLIALIDKSGSMQGTKLEMVKKTMNFVLQQLKPADRLGIVVYDSFVSELLPLTTMTADHKEQALHLIKEIRAGTSTNLSGALFKGIEILTKRTERKDVSSVLLFTDGLANQGITKAPQIVGTMEKQLGNFQGVCTVFTFGFGADHSPEMLRAIAEAGKGMYYFVERDDDIPQAFGDCLGGLLSVVAQNLELTIEAVEPGVEIKHLNGSHHVLSKTATKMKINLGDIYSEERRNLVCTVSLPAKEKPSPQRDFFLRFNLEYFHLLEGQTQRRFADAYISRPETTPLNQRVNPLVEVQLSRIQALKAMEEAKQAAEKGDLIQARTILQTGMNKVSKVQTSNIVSEGLMVDMQDCLQDLQSERDYKQKGKQKLMQNAMVHSRERAVHTNDCYANTRKKATKAAFL